MSAQTAILIEAARLALGGGLIGVGLVFMAGGALAMLRFPDFYTRLHAASVSDAIGGVILLAGLALACGDAHIAWKLVLLAGLISLPSPTIRHLAANAAHAGGLAPMAGPSASSRSASRGAKR
jgi:multicomponent Na+:H+ antiporter subunit G